MLFRSRACLPEWSSQSSPGYGGSPTAFPQPRPCCHIWHLTALSAGRCWKMWSGALAHRVICWCGKSWHSSKITRLCCGPDDFLQRPLSAPGLLGVGCFVVSVSFVGSSLSFFFYFTVDVCCVCVFISSEYAFVTGLSFLWKVRLGMHAHKNKLTLTMCPLYLTWFESIHRHGAHSSGWPTPDVGTPEWRYWCCCGHSSPAWPSQVWPGGGTSPRATVARQPASLHLGWCAAQRGTEAPERSVSAGLLVA